MSGIFGIGKAIKVNEEGIRIDKVKMIGKSKLIQNSGHFIEKKILPFVINIVLICYFF